VTEKTMPKKFNPLFAFVLGVGIMIVMYLLFAATTRWEQRNRTGSDTDSSGTATASAEVINVGSLTTASNVETVQTPSAFLGVQIISVNSVIAEQLGISSKKGVLINGVAPNSPAQQAGLKRGDVIIALNNRNVKDEVRFKEILAELEPGAKVRIVYIRDEKKDSTYALLAQAPSLLKTIAQSTATSGVSTSNWGISLSPLTPSLRKLFAIPPDIQGVVILSVTPGAVADKAGLVVGDVITSVGKTPVSDINDFFSAIMADKDNIALLDVFSQGQTRYVPLDSSAIKLVADQTQTQSQTTLRQKIVALFTGGSLTLTAGDTTAFNRPSSVPGDVNTGGSTGGSSGGSTATGMNRPSEVPSQSGGPTNEIVLFVGLLLLVILYFVYREYYDRPVKP